MITPLQYDNKKPSQILTKSNEWFVRAITDTKIRLNFFKHAQISHFVPQTHKRSNC